MSKYEDVYRLVKHIPRGKVTTYGEISRVLGTKDARKIGWAMQSNRSPSVPCHRVVTRDGRLAPNFAFNGAGEQRKRLEAEGVEFLDEMHVELQKCFYRFS